MSVICYLFVYLFYYMNYCHHLPSLCRQPASFSGITHAFIDLSKFTLQVSYRSGGSTLGPGGTRPPNLAQAPPKKKFFFRVI